MAKRGRKSSYTKKLANELCELLANGYTLRKACKQEGLPSFATVKRWLRDESPFRDEFRAHYARACEDRADNWADEAIEIADDGTNDWFTRETDDGEVTTCFNHEHVQRSKLRIDTRKWLIATAYPKKYGGYAENDGQQERRPEVINYIVMPKPDK